MNKPKDKPYNYFRHAAAAKLLILVGVINPSDEQRALAEAMVEDIRYYVLSMKHHDQS